MRRFLILFCLLLLLVACGRGSDEPNIETEDPTAEAPAAATSTPEPEEPTAEATLEGTPVATLTPDPDEATSDETSVIDTVANLPEFQSLTALLRQVELTDKLQTAGPYVLLAPTDAAFEALPAAVLSALSADEDDLQDVLMYHIVVGEFDADALRTADAPIPTLLGDDFDPGDTTFGDELPASNGRVYPIDQLLIPTSVELVSSNIDQETVVEEATDQDQLRDNPVELDLAAELPEEQIIDKASASGTIFNILSANENISQLVGLLETTELNRTLSEDPGPFTFFAPTNEAVNALGQETIDLITNEPRTRLAPILLYHLTDGIIDSVELAERAADDLLMVGDAEAFISMEDNVLRLDDAQIIQYDIEAENGVIHVLDAVIVPTVEQGSLLAVDSVFVDEQATEDDNRIAIGDRGEINNLLDTLIAASDATILVNLLEAAGLTDVIQTTGANRYTIFAPTDTAFRALPDGTLESLDDAPTGEVAPLILYHMAPGEYRTIGMSTGQLPTLTNQMLDIVVDGDTITVNGAQIVASDILADNGVIHFIDAVLMAEE